MPVSAVLRIPFRMDPHHFLGTRIRIRVKIRIRFRIKIKCRIWISISNTAAETRSGARVLIEPQMLTLEPWSVSRPMVADSHRSERPDPNDADPIHWVSELKFCSYSTIIWLDLLPTKVADTHLFWTC
jgi:hypothetical protein